MKELQEVLESLTKLVTALGPGWTIVLFAVAFGYHLYREHRKERAERSIADEKEVQIQRLADDNRWMRRVLMEKVMGFSEAEAERLNQGQTTPLLSGRDSKKDAS